MTTDSLQVEAIERARKVGLDPAIMATALLAQRGERQFVVEIEDKTSGGQFFRCTQEGPTRVLYLNVGHPFYRTIYDPPGATADYRASIEVFLWVVGTSALDASPADQLRYAQEFRRWSEHLRVAAPILDGVLGLEEEREALIAEDET